MYSLFSVNQNNYKFNNIKGKAAFFHFYDNGSILEDSSLCCITLKAGGNMRFRWNEENIIRKNLLNDIALCLSDKSVKTGRLKSFVPVQLEHTKIVYNIKNQEDSKNKIGDGLITSNSDLIPSVTVADCVPIYLYNKGTGVFGIVHSGWKGTGIGAEAIKLALKEYGGNVSDFYVVIGPHIKSCCYIVNEERAKYFSENFTPDCVSPLEEGISVSWNNGNGKLYRLSLDKANLALFKSCGVPASHIAICSDCTCCNNIFGSNRRETSHSGKPDNFTVMAAFISKI